MYERPSLSTTSPLKRLPPNIRIVVVHPVYESARLLLMQALADGCYLCIDVNVTSRDTLSSALEGAAAAQTAPIDQVKTIILDETDRISVDLMIEFIGHLLTRIAPNAHIVLFSRRLPVRLIEHEPWRAWMCVLENEPAEEQRLLNADDEKPMHRLYVRAFGSGRVMLNDAAIDRWDGALPRALFFFMVDRQLAARHDVFDIFWPNLNRKAATNVFHVTKRKMRDVLGFELTRYGGGFYRLSPRLALVYDVSHFLDLVTQAEHTPSAQAVPLLKRAVGLYRSGYLTSIAAPWTDVRQKQLQAVFTEVLVMLGRAMLEQGEERAALGYFARALHHQLYREDIALSAMRLYDGAGLRGDALRLYERVYAEIENTLGVRPGAALQAYAQELRGG